MLFAISNKSNTFAIFGYKESMCVCRKVKAPFWHIPREHNKLADSLGEGFKSVLILAVFRDHSEPEPGEVRGDDMIPDCEFRNQVSELEGRRREAMKQ